MSEYQSLKEWAEAEPDALRRPVEAIGGDGHSVWGPGKFPDVPEHLLPVRDHHSDGTPKGSIWDSDGQVIEKLTGVYGLGLAGALVRALGLKARSVRGRGSQCREYCRVLTGYLDGLG